MLAREYPAFVDALLDITDAIKNGDQIEDPTLEALVEAERSDAGRKRLVMGLKTDGVITDEQATFAIAYRWPLRSV